MSDITSVPTVAAPRIPAAEASNTIGDLSTDEYFDIILAELANQDPLEPNDTSAMLEQLASIRTIESDLDLITALETLVGQNELSSAASIIGSSISGVSEDNRRVDGVVRSASATDTGAVLTLEDGTRLPMSQVDEIVGAAVQPNVDQSDNEDEDNGGEPL
ncbi:MAG: flagellar hook capping FlgD N-terminal domain-containing protein [Planctomycetota bacterium]